MKTNTLICREEEVKPQECDESLWSQEWTHDEWTEGEGHTTEVFKSDRELLRPKMVQTPPPAQLPPPTTAVTLRRQTAMIPAKNTALLFPLAFSEKNIII